MRGDFICPSMMMHRLERPAWLAARRIERDDRAAVAVHKVIAVPAPVIGGGIAHRHIDEAERLVGAHRRPAIGGPRREGVAFGRWAMFAGAAEVPGPGKGPGRHLVGAGHHRGLEWTRTR